VGASTSQPKNDSLGGHLLPGGPQDRPAAGNGGGASRQGKDGGEQRQGGGDQAHLLQSASSGDKLDLHAANKITYIAILSGKVCLSGT